MPGPWYESLFDEAYLDFYPALRRTLSQLKKLARLDRLLQELLAEHPHHVHLRLALARHQALRSPEQALETLGALLAEHPTLIPARREAAKLLLQRGDVARIRQSLEELLQVLAEADRGFRCRSCGHADTALFWRCPACASWDTVRVAWGRRAGERPARQGG